MCCLPDYPPSDAAAAREMAGHDMEDAPGDESPGLTDSDENTASAALLAHRAWLEGIKRQRWVSGGTAHPSRLSDLFSIGRMGMGMQMRAGVGAADAGAGGGAAAAAAAGRPPAVPPLFDAPLPAPPYLQIAGPRADCGALAFSGFPASLAPPSAAHAVALPVHPGDLSATSELARARCAAIVALPTKAPIQATLPAPLPVCREEIAALRVAHAGEAARAADLEGRLAAAAEAVAGHVEGRERLGAEAERLAAENAVLKRAFVIQARRSKELEARAADAEAGARGLAVSLQRLEQTNSLLRVQLAHQDAALAQAARGGMHFWGGGGQGPGGGGAGIS